MIGRNKIDLIHRLARLGQQDALRRTIRQMTVTERCDLVGVMCYGRDSGSLSEHLARSHRHGDHSPSLICEMAIAECLENALKKAKGWPREARLSGPNLYLVNLAGPD